jgi:hypothetical protein
MFHWRKYVQVLRIEDVRWFLYLGWLASRTRSIMMASAGMANDTNGMPSPTSPHSALEHKVRSELADEGVQV